MKNFLLTTVFWLYVVTPLAWGVYQTLLKTSQLFTH